MKMHIVKRNIFRLLALLSLVLLTCFSCSRDDSNGNNNSSNDSYYVKYIIDAPGPYGRFSNWTASTPSGLYSNSGYQTSGWTQTYGPLNKGFLCKVEIGDYQGGTPTIEIHVSKNDEPFALKKIVTGSSASYVIN
jgi:hypothetical protein